MRKTKVIKAIIEKETYIFMSGNIIYINIDRKKIYTNNKETFFYTELEIIDINDITYAFN